MAVQTAIEYGVRRLRLLEFEGTARKLRVLGVHEVNLDVAVDPGGEQDPNDVRAAALSDAMKECDFARDPCGMCFDGASATFREFDLPFTGNDQIEKVVHFESESHFQGDLDDFVIQHHVLRKTRDKSHILAVGVRKNELLDRLDILDESGLDPMFVDLDVYSLFNALVGTGLTREHERFVVVDAQDSATSLIFVAAGEIVATRAMRIGAHGLGAEPQSAGASASAAEDQAEIARRHEFVARLTREIRRTLSNLPDLGTPEVVYVTGVGSALPGFAAAMGELLGGPGEELDLLSRVEHKLTAEEARQHGRSLGAALGVAYRLVGQESLLTDFRRDEVAYTHKFDQVKTPLIVAGLLLFLVAAFHALDGYKRVQRLELEYDRMSALGGKYLGDLLEDQAAADARWTNQPTGPRRMQAVLDAARELREDIKRKLGRSADIKDLDSALAVWIKFFETLRRHEDELGPLAFDRLDIDTSTRTPQLKFSGEVTDLGRYQRLEDRLKEVPMFRDLRSGGTQQTSTGLRFSELTIDLDLAQAVDEEEA
ncbi:MAG: pilus assembly protein PilM [Planctomycetota bacterium]